MRYSNAMVAAIIEQAADLRKRKVPTFVLSLDDALDLFTELRDLRKRDIAFREFWDVAAGPVVAMVEFGEAMRAAHAAMGLSAPVEAKSDKEVSEDHGV